MAVRTAAPQVSSPGRWLGGGWTPGTADSFADARDPSPTPAPSRGRPGSAADEMRCSAMPEPDGYGQFPAPHVPMEVGLDDGGRATARTPRFEAHLNPATGVVHGAALLRLLVDNADGERRHVRGPEGQYATSVDIQLRFVRPVFGGHPGRRRRGPSSADGTSCTSRAASPATTTGSSPPQPGPSPPSAPDRGVGLCSTPSSSRGASAHDGARLSTTRPFVHHVHAERRSRRRSARRSRRWATRSPAAHFDGFAVAHLRLGRARYWGARPPASRARPAPRRTGTAAGRASPSVLLPVPVRHARAGPNPTSARISRRIRPAAPGGGPLSRWRRVADRSAVALTPQSGPGPPR